MTLLLHELKNSELFQVIKPEQNEFVKAIRLHLYKHNNPAGSLRVEVRDINNKKVAVSDAVLIADIPGQFYHGLITFNISVSLKSGTEYRVYLTNDESYSFSESAFVGWCNSYDLTSYPATYTNNNSIYAPLALEVWSLK